MGFLNHSTNNIVIDAVLTNKGREKIANKLDLVTREEFIVLKKIIEKQQKEINKLKKKKLKR